MWQIQHEVVIHGTPALIWNVLTDLAHYPHWNQYSPAAHGDLSVGGYVEIVAKVGRSAQRVNNRVLEVQPGQRLCWASHTWYRALVYGVRCRTITPQPDGTAVFHEQETMHGPLAWLVGRLLQPQLLAGLRLECENLKAEVERLTHL